MSAPKSGALIFAFMDKYPFAVYSDAQKSDIRSIEDRSAHFVIIAA